MFEHFSIRMGRDDGLEPRPLKWWLKPLCWVGKHKYILITSDAVSDGSECNRCGAMLIEIIKVETDGN